MATRNQISPLLAIGIVASITSSSHPTFVIADNGSSIIGGDLSPPSDDPASIVGGAPSANGAYPFFAVAGPPLQGVCGAALIHADILISAAHCYKYWKGYNICIGATKLDCSDASDIILAERDYIYPDYSPNGLPNDIMLIKLASPSTAQLATWNKNATVPAEDTIVVATGLGLTETSSVPNTLQEVNLTVADAATCFRASDSFVPEKVICAYGDGLAGICNGDS